ncbi:uncharacterized protein CBL_11564 [Carabus blaptoides fortunei]
MTGKKPLPNYLNFVFGGSAGMMASAVVQPLDLIKNRMQLSGMEGGQKKYKTSLHAAKSIIASEGVLALYNGLTAGLLRQATYTTTRLGVYNWLFDLVTGKEGVQPNFATKVGLGMVAGACGAFVGTPAEVCLIRMTADGTLPPHERRNYKHVGDALFRITKEEGLFTLWRGCLPTMFRALVVNAAQLSTYSQAKQQLLQTKYFTENMFLHFCASMISGFTTSVASLPVDIVKTRIQNMKIVDGVPEYKGAGEALMKIISNEGVLALWKGFTPYYARIGPHTVLTFIFLEQLNDLYQKFAR